MKDHELIRALRARRRTGPKRGWRCLDEHLLAAYADNRLADDQRRKIEAHLSRCGYCLDQVAALAQLSGGHVPANVPADLLVRAREIGSTTPLRGWTPAWGWSAAGAAAAGVVLATFLWMRQPQPGMPPVVPEIPRAVVSVPVTVPLPAQSPEAVRSRTSVPLELELIHPGEGAVLAGRNLEFRWSPVARSLFYEVRLMTAEGALIWEERAETNDIRVPRTVRLEAGKKYYVSVLAYLPDGKTVKSKTVGFETR